MNSPKKVLIIGGAGFIGSWTTHQLINQGHIVWIIDPFYNYSHTDQSLVNKILDFRKNSLLKNAKIISEDYLKVGSGVIKDFKPDIVIDLANIPIEISKDKTLSEKQLLDYPKLTFQIVSDVKKYRIKRYIFLSSVYVYGHSNSWGVSEDASISPNTPYGISKATSEFIIKAHLNNWVILRTTSVYGFGDIYPRVAQIFVNQALEKKTFWVNHNAILDFTYVKDLVNGIAKAALSNLTREVFHLTSGKAISLPQLASALTEYFPDLKYQLKDKKQQRTMGTLNNTKARVLLDWDCEYSIKTGLKDYMKYVKKFGFA